VIKQWKGTIVHLTMYGQTLEQSMKELNKKKDVLIIVGAEKVPPFYYEISDYNISISNQPHSEVAALAVFLDKYTNGLWKTKTFNGEMTILPASKGKQVVTKR
jgi:tRNA (cytidine56-2'-O)-methyltransferase